MNLRGNYSSCVNACLAALFVVHGAAAVTSCLKREPLDLVMENDSVYRNLNPEELFSRFSDAEEASDILHTFQTLLDVLGFNKTANRKTRDCYSLLKSKLQSWKCKSLWELLDSRVNLKEYGKSKSCEDLQVLIIGAGPIGLRTAIEAALLGAQVVVVEKRTAFSRNNVLHLWPFLLSDFRSLGAKKFYGKFCSGSIDHISKWLI